MQRLDEIIDFYLKTDTNYALMITGKWGVGKTYYFKNILKKQISESPTFDNGQKNYKPILVSLFGLKSVEEIQTEIFLSLCPMLKNKSVKLGASIGKSLIKGIMHLKNLGEYYDYVAEAGVDKGDWINFSELVICFDDLERLSEKLNIEEFIGYTNTLVENENVKILIIANENKIDNAKYFALKEKVVGNSIEFIPELSISYDSLIESKFAGYPTYKTFLTENKNYILEVFIKNSSNLRILVFALTYFQRIFSEIKIRLSPKDILKAKENEILFTLVKFSLAISIEYKAGNISFTKKENLDWSGTLDWSNISLENLQFGNSNKEKKEEEKTFRDKFIEKYYSGDNFSYFNSVYVFLTGGSVLKYDELIQELKMHYHIEENKILPQYEVLNVLGYQTVFSLSDKEYNQLTRKMLKYSDCGSYDISNYVTIFSFASRFGNPLKYNLDKLERRIILGMKAGKANYKYIDQLDFYLIVDENAEHKDRLIRIRKVALALNKQINTNNQISDSARLEKICYENFEQFFTEVLSNDKPYFYTPIFQTFSVHKFYLLFINNENKLRWEMVRFWSKRYRDFPASQLKVEIDFLEKLKQKTEKKISSLSKHGVTYFVFSELVRVLQKSITRLNATT